MLVNASSHSNRSAPKDEGKNEPLSRSAEFNKMSTAHNSPRQLYPETREADFVALLGQEYREQDWTKCVCVQMPKRTKVKGKRIPHLYIPPWVLLLTPITLTIPQGSAPTQASPSPSRLTHLACPVPLIVLFFFYHAYFYFRL